MIRGWPTTDQCHNPNSIHHS